MNVRHTPLYFSKAIAGLVMFAAAGIANASVLATLEDVTNGGGFFANITFWNNGSNTVRVTADIAAPINIGLTKGDILGLWLDIADETLLTGMNWANDSPSGTVTAFIASANNVNQVGSSNNNLNGTGEANFDIGLQVGTQGSPFNKIISFDLISSGLTELAFVDQRVGMRVQSIEGVIYSSGSAKLIGSGGPGLGGGDIPQVPEPAPLALFVLGGSLIGWFNHRKQRA